MLSLFIIYSVVVLFLVFVPLSNVLTYMAFFIGITSILIFITYIHIQDWLEIHSINSKFKIAMVHVMRIRQLKTEEKLEVIQYTKAIKKIQKYCKNRWIGIFVSNKYLNYPVLYWDQKTDPRYLINLFLNILK